MTFGTYAVLVLPAVCRCAAADVVGLHVRAVRRRLLLHIIPLRYLQVVLFL